MPIPPQNDFGRSTRLPVEHFTVAEEICYYDGIRLGFVDIAPFEALPAQRGLLVYVDSEEYPELPARTLHGMQIHPSTAVYLVASMTPAQEARLRAGRPIVEHLRDKSTETLWVLRLGHAASVRVAHPDDIPGDWLPTKDANVAYWLTQAAPDTSEE